MKGFGITSAVVAVGLHLITSVLADVDPIIIKGNKFFYKTNGTEFFIKGVAYQQDIGANGSSTTNVNYKDPLTDVDGCKRDIPYLQQLSTNTIRVYAIDPTQDHSQCMQALQAAGIYLIADLSAPNNSINRDSPNWDVNLYNRYTSVIDSLQQYNNVIGFFAGNEVSNNASNVDAIPFVKAAVRDMKAYVKQKNYRSIGIGYASDDDATIRTNLEDYLNCGDPSTSIDFFGYNIYSWCGHSSFQQSGYQQRTQELQGYPVPAFFAEYGCNTEGNRTFEETGTLYGSQMTGVWSGGIVYMYFQETNNYGLVTVSGSSVSKLPDFTALSSQIAKVTPSSVNAASFNPTATSARSCPTTGTDWQAATPLPPTPNGNLCGCMVANLTCVAKTSLSSDDINTQFGFVCDPANGDNCVGFQHYGNNGSYGAYAGCNATDQLSWAFNQYYQSQVAGNPGNTQACGFGGAASTQSPGAPSGTCSSLLQQAGSAGTGVVTSVPSGTGSGSGTSGSSTASKSGVAGQLTIPNFNFGLLQLGAYVTVAAMAGAGMVLL